MGRKVNIMKDMLLLLAVVVIWFVLQKYILPRFGIQT